MSGAWMGQGVYAQARGGGGGGEKTDNGPQEKGANFEADKAFKATF